MKAVTAAQMRELDRRAIEGGVPAETLMERAGIAVADAVETAARAATGLAPARVVAVAGKGNNGGDAFVAARALRERGLDARVLLAAPAGGLTGAAASHFTRMRACGVPVEEPRALGTLTAQGRWVVIDGILGTGLSGPVRGAAAAAIDAVNAAGERHAVIAADIPSGLNADTGCPEGRAVRADTTVTMGFPKRGLLLPPAVEFVGALEVADIGIPGELAAGIPEELELIVPGDTPALWRRRDRAAHKGTYGHVLLIGGSPGYAGAIAMAARAAVRSGAGLVSVLTPESLVATVAALVPEAMVHGGACTEAGTLASDALTRWGRELSDFDALVLGPGLGLHRQSTALAERILAGSRVPLVVDADALGAFSNRLFLVGRATCPVILTPHPGELARLLNRGVDEIQADRFKAAADAAKVAPKAVVVLKGAGTIVAQAGRPPAVNLTGNPGMATGGSGDVLAGLLGGLCAQRHEVRDAARAAVYLHGRAGDLAARRLSQAALCAGDLIDALPAAFLEQQPGT